MLELVGEFELSLGDCAFALAVVKNWTLKLTFHICDNQASSSFGLHDFMCFRYFGRQFLTEVKGNIILMQQLLLDKDELLLNCCN